MRIDFQRPFAAPPGGRDVLLVRHGSVDAPTPDGLIGGRSDPPLNAAGRAQAEAIARRLAGEPIAALFTTQLVRTGQTAQPLQARTGARAVALDELGEVYLGSWEGHGIASRGAAADPEFLAMIAAGRWDRIPGAEPADAFAQRVRDGLERVADAGRDDAVCVAVTHSGVIAELCRQITGSEPFAFLTALANGSLTRVVRMPDGRWTLVAFNDTAHLLPGPHAT